MEYHHAFPRFSHPPARHAPSADGYFHRYSPVFPPFGHDHFRVANGGIDYGFLFPVASVDSVWVVSAITGAGQFLYSRAYGRVPHVDIVNHTRRNAAFEPSGRLRGGIREDDTWVLDSHDHNSQDLPPESSLQAAPSANKCSTEHSVSKFLETRTSDIMSGDEEICVVCQDDLGTDRIAALDCRHRYHVECIKTWLTLKNFCPICKAETLSTVDSRK